MRKLEQPVHDTHSHATPSRLNGENIAGAAFLFFAALFMAAGQVNAVFAVVYPVDYLLAAAGVALVLLGYRTWRNASKEVESSESVRENLARY